MTVFEESVVLYETRFPTLKKKLDEARGLFWIPSQPNLSEDHESFLKLSKEEQNLAIYVVAFFAQSDKLVNANIESNYMNMFKCDECKMFFHYQEMIEDVHTEVYSLMFRAIMPDETQRNDVISNLEKYGAIHKKRQWIERWGTESCTPGEALIAAICAEGIMFCTSFLYIFYFDNNGFLKGAGEANSDIAADERTHYEFAIELYHLLPDEYKLQRERIDEIFMDAVDIEKTFLREAQKNDLPKLTLKQSEKYVEFVANSLYDALGLSLPFPESLELPVPFMARIGAMQKSNFFEKRNTTYARLNAFIEDDHEKDFNLIDDF